MENMSIPVNIQFDSAKPVNDSFTSFACKIMAIGKNRNGSAFSRSTVEAAIDKFRNLPITAFVYTGDDGKKHIAGHEMKVVEEDGKYKWQTKCVPYGVIPADAEFGFEDVTEEDGTVATYLVTSAILWTKKYPDIVEAAYGVDGSYWASMEINVLGTHKEEGDAYIEITDFTPEAFTLLGKSDDPKYNVTPCFPSAGLIPYSLDEQFSTLMEEFKTALAECFAEKDGGETMKDELDVVENQPEEIQEQEFQAEEAAEEQQPEQEEFEQKDTEPECFALWSKLTGAVNKAVNSLGYSTDGVFVFYHPVDFDDQYIYVYRYYYEDGMADFEKSPMRFAYTKHETESDVTIDIAAEGEQMYIEWLTKEQYDTVKGMERSFAEYKESHSTDNDTVNELIKFKQDRLAQDRAEAVNAVFEQFEDLSGNNDFEALKQNVGDMDVADIEEKCFAIRGKIMKPKTKTPVRTPIIKEEVQPEPYGGIFSYYGKK